MVEAKPEGFPLTGIETQSGKYLDPLPKSLPLNGPGCHQALDPRADYPYPCPSRRAHVRDALVTFSAAC